MSVVSVCVLHVYQKSALTGKRNDRGGGFDRGRGGRGGFRGGRGDHRGHGGDDFDRRGRGGFTG